MGPPPMSPAISYWDMFPKRQQLFDARKRRNESLANWAARLTRLGEDAEYTNAFLLDMVLRDRFVVGLDPGPLRDFLKPRPDIHTFTFKEVQELAFTTAILLEREAKAKAKAEANLVETAFDDSD